MDKINHSKFDITINENGNITFDTSMDDTANKRMEKGLVKRNDQVTEVDECETDNDPILNFMNAKIELSVVIQNLTQIAHKYLRTFEVYEGLALAEKIERLREATHKGNSLVEFLNEIFKDSVNSQHSDMVIKIEPVVNGDDAFAHLSIKQNSPPSPQFEHAEEDLCDNINDKNSIEADKILVEINATQELLCGKCNTTFKTLSMLKSHTTIHEDTQMSYYCDICETSFFSKQNLKVHNHRHTGDKPVSCGICLKTFTSERYLKSHKKIHETPTHHCELCTKSFVASVDLQRHMRNHTGERPFICDQCPKAFSQRMSLSNHKKFHGKANFHCEEDNCSKSFVMKADLERHKRVHTGVKPYCCELCGKSYADLASLKYHKQMVHSICTGDSIHLAFKNRFFCDKCEKSFPRPQNLKVHQRKHTGERPFQCDQCPKSFPLKQGLQKHILNIHTGEKPFLCDQCDHACKTKWLLQQHVDARHDDTRYSCEVCDFTTTQKRLIQRHNNIYHKEVVKRLSNPYSNIGWSINKQKNNVQRDINLELQ